MGKWTSGYYDQVLQSKLKSLVIGAIKRSKLENSIAEPEINFERFVEQLDAGDSFTTSLVEILVKEVADRQSRSNVDDRRLIGEKTAKSLRLITHNRLYYSSSASASSSRFRRAAGGPRYSHPRIPPYLTSPPDELDLDDDDEEEDFTTSILEAEPSIRRRDLILDNYTQSVPSSSNSSSSTVAGSTFVVPPFPERSASPAPMATDETSLPPTFTSRPWHTRPYIAPNPNLTRSSSVRRPTRSRTVDFNDFTTRRRSTNRNNSDSAGAGENSSERDRSRGASSASAPGARRFFPSISRRLRVEPDSDAHPWSDLDLGDGGNDIPTPASSYSPPGRFRNFRFSTSYQSMYHSDDTATAEEGETEPTSDERNAQGDENGAAGRARASTPSIVPLPRLRRGGLRAPESLLSRQTSPHMAVGGAETSTASLNNPSSDTSRRAPSPPEISLSDYLAADLANYGSVSGGGARTEREGARYRVTDLGFLESSHGYPTPGSSIDNDGV